MSADLTQMPPASELIPGRKDGFSAIGSANAPVVYFEDTPAFGSLYGVVRITLSTSRDMPVLGGHAVTDHIVVGHLRMSLDTARTLKNAIERCLMAAEPPPTDAVN